MTVTPFRDPSGNSNLCAVLIETPDMASLQSALETEQAEEAQEYDGVQPDPIKLFIAQ